MAMNRGLRVVMIRRVEMFSRDCRRDESPRQQCGCK